MRKEKRFELRLSDDGASALEYISSVTGLTRTAIIEMVLREEAVRRRAGVREPMATASPDTSVPRTRGAESWRELAEEVMRRG